MKNNISLKLSMIKCISLTKFQDKSINQDMSLESFILSLLPLYRLRIKKLSYLPILSPISIVYPMSRKNNYLLFNKLIKLAWNILLNSSPILEISHTIIKVFLTTVNPTSKPPKLQKHKSMAIYSLLCIQENNQSIQFLLNQLISRTSNQTN